MFTVCPKCTLTLAVTANDLRTGQGYVRCGRCSNVFNALLTLSEQPPEFAAPTPPAARTPRTAPAARAAAKTGKPDEASSIQIDQILMLGTNAFPRPQGAPAPATTTTGKQGTASTLEGALAQMARPASGVAVARGAPSTPSGSSPPRAAPEGAARGRVEPTSGPAPPSAADAEIASEDITGEFELPQAPVSPRRAPSPAARSGNAPIKQSAGEPSSESEVMFGPAGEAELIEDTGTRRRAVETIVLEGESFTHTEAYVSEEQAGLEALKREIESLGDAEPNAPRAAATIRARPAPPAAARASAARAPALPPAEAAAPDSESAPAASEFPFRLRSPGILTHRWAWLTGTIALAVLLLAQLVNHWRDALAGSPSVGGLVTRTYRHFGVAIEPHWDLNAYEVRQQGATTDPNDAHVIHVRLSLANHASRSQPVPLLRLTLLDRYGKRIARRDLTPAEYWPRGRARTEFLAGDQRLDSEVAVDDPKADSASFELDVCLAAHQRIECAGDGAAATVSALAR